MFLVCICRQECCWFVFVGRFMLLVCICRQECCWFVFVGRGMLLVVYKVENTEPGLFLTIVPGPNA